MFYPEDYEEDSYSNTKRTDAAAELPDASDLLPRALVENAIGLEGIKEIAGQSGFCLVVKTPSGDWAKPVMQYLRSLGEWDYYHCKTKPDKSSILDGSVSANVVNALASGGRVLGVTSELKLLPSSMLMNADRHIVLPQPNGRVVAAVIRAVTGTHPGELADTIASGLSFDELAASIRANSTAQECVFRIERAVASKLSVDPEIASAPLISDLHGYGDAKHWCEEVVADLDAWRRGDIEFEAIQSRVLLCSKPGLGKSSLARSLARSTGCPLIASSVPQWFASSNGNLDGVIKQIDDVFDRAKALAPAIVLLDECDALPARDKIDNRNKDYWTPVIAHVLLKLDSAVSDATNQLIIIGATNHPNALDSALLRSGRLDRVIEIKAPDAVALEGIFRQHLHLDLEGAKLAEAARLATGGTGADVKAWVRAARRTARTAGRPMVFADLLEAIAPVDISKPELLMRTAIHEAGHAIVANAVGLTVKAISIVPKGGMAGYTHILHEDDLPTRHDLERLILHALGGRSAEEVCLGDPGVGAGGNAMSDLAFATRMMGMLHLSTGSGDNLLYQADPDDVQRALTLNPIASAAVELELRRLYAKALSIVRSNKSLVDTVAAELLRARHIDEAGFLDLVRQWAAERVQIRG